MTNKIKKLSFEVEWRGNNLYTRISGRLKVDDFLVYNQEIKTDKRYDQRSYEIIDFTEVEEVIVSREEVEIPSTLDKYFARWDSGPKLAFVVKNPYIEELCIAYTTAMEGSGWDIRIFKSQEEAEQWCIE